MGRKEEYKLQNEQFMQALCAEADVCELPCGILYKVLEFDNSWKRNCPEAFRLSEVIEGWQIALQKMRVGDRWIIYIPYTMGYGTRTSGPIPAFSTLVFEVQLLGIA